MAVAFVQVKRNGAASGSTLDVTLDTAPANNGLLLAHGSINNASATVDSVNQNPTGTPVAFTAVDVTHTGGGSGTLKTRLFILNGCTTNTLIRCAYSTSSSPIGLVVHEISGFDATTPYTNTSGVGYIATGGSSGTPTSSNLVTDFANVILCVFAKTPNAVTWTAGSGYTVRTPPSGTQREGSEDQVVSSTGTYAPSVTLGSSQDFDMWVIAIRAPAGGVTPLNLPPVMVVVPEPALRAY